MTDYKLVPICPTPEMVEAAEDAYMPFGDMDMAIRMALLAAPAVQGEPVELDRYDAGLLGGQDGMPAYVWHDIIRAELDRAYDFYMDQLDRAAPQPAEQQPALARYQPCGCVVCTCEHETQCQGCGAHHCGTHPVGQIPEPAYQQQSPDVKALVEALEQCITSMLDNGYLANALVIRAARAALAAHRKGAQP